MMLLRNTPEFVASFFAASQMGAISVPTNTRLKAPEIEYILKDSDPTILIVDPSCGRGFFRSRIGPQP